MGRLDRRWLVLSTVVLLVAAALRFDGLNWDGGIGAHPDERYILGVAEGLRWPDAMDPFAGAPDYAYGHLPLYLLALLRRLSQPGDILPAARALAALFDLGTVALAGALARRLYGKETGWLTMACVGLAVMHVQQAHFYTVDVVAVSFVMAALYCAVRLSERKRGSDALWAGAWAGLALGSKFSVGLLVLPLGAACAALPAHLRWRRGLQAVGAALVAFAATNPFALLRFRVFWRNVAQQAAIARGALDVPYTRQFHATWAYLYSLEQQLRWGMGLLLGLVACAGLVYTVWTALRRSPRTGEWVVLAWAVPGLAFFGGLYTRFPRYLLPLMPVLCLYAARFVLLAPALQPFRLRGYRPRRARRWGPVLLALMLGELLLRALALRGMYAVAHPWLAASHYLEEQAPAGAVIAVEEWDQPLPVQATGYELRTLPIFDEDTPEKWVEITGMLAEADYIVIASQRGYGALARWPERYPLTTRYYRLLFAGGLGFEPLKCFERAPRLGPFLALVDDPAGALALRLPSQCQPQTLATWELGRLDESFVVYDHPQTVIFRRTASGFSAEELRAMIEGQG